MMKNFLFAAALLSLALASGCAKGGSGPCVSGCATIIVDDTSNGIADVSEAPISAPAAPSQVTFTASPKNTTLSAVNWTITGASCSSSSTDSANPCGYFTSGSTSTTITYQAPTTVPSSPAFTVTATSQSDTSLSGTLDMTVVNITTAVTPASPNVGVGLSQQFTAIAIPDNANQSFGTWSCTVTPKGQSSTPCHNPLTACPNVANNACFVYTPVSGEECGNNCVQISAPPAASPSECTNTPADCATAQPVVVANRVSGNYAFQFSGYDNNGNQVLVAGSFTVASSGSISGVEDELTSSGPQTSIQITGGAYTPTSSNNAGTLTLTTGAYPNAYRVVLDGAGDMQMIESDNHGIGSGIAEPVSGNNKFNTSAQTFVFGFTGVDSSTPPNRVGYGGLMPIDGNGNVTSGLIDINDNGSTTNICSSPCSVGGTYSYNTSTNEGNLTLTLGSVTQHFDFFVANGSANNNSLTLYAISTDTVDATHPAVLGTMAMQNPKLTYNNAAFSGTSVSALTGAGGNVSLTLGSTDGTSSGTGGTGNFTGQFDQNNAGTILSVSAFPSATQTTNPYTYVATNNKGRYIFYMLGNPSASTAVPPIPFVLYASAKNGGFLLDQNSSAVMTGTMTPQTAPKQNGGFFVPATMTGTYAVATNSNSLSTSSSCSVMGSCAVTMNLLLTSPGGGVFDVTGTENPGDQSVNLTYDMNTTGVGAFSPISPAKTPNYVFYATTGTDFYVIEVDSTIPSPILFMAQ